MVTLEINNSYSKLLGLNPKQEREVRELLSYTENAKSAYFGRGYARKRYLIDKRGGFPTGLLHRLPPWAMAVVDNRIKPISQSLGYISKDKPYSWQVEATKAAQQAHRGIISAPTGTGKSMAMSILVARLNVKTLIVVPTIEIKKQLKETIQLPNVTIENIDSKALNNLKNVDCLIIDEAHHVAAKTYQRLNKTVWTDIYYRFFFTATPFRNETDEMLLFEAIAGQVIYKLDYQAAIKEGYIVPIEAYYFEVPKQTTDAYSYREVYNELVVNNLIRNEIISNLLLKLNASNKSTLCLVKEVAHGKLLSEITGLYFVSGEDDESRDYIRQFNRGEITTLIGTTGILGEGVDTKPCEYVIIAGLGKAKSQFMQQVGRAVRKYPGKDSAKVILIQDKSHRFLTRHFNAQQRILRAEYCTMAYKLEGI
jgi:superfamily II DNA or RNA helicase